MKKILSLTFFLSLLIKMGFSQNQPTFYYDYLNHKIYSDKDHKKILQQRLFVKYGNCINVQVFNFNPLNTKILIDDSSRQFFLSDTSKLSNLIILPKVSDVSNTDGNQKDANDTNKIINSKKCKDWLI